MGAASIAHAHQGYTKCQMNPNDIPMSWFHPHGLSLWLRADMICPLVWLLMVLSHCSFMIVAGPVGHLLLLVVNVVIYIEIRDDIIYIYIYI